MAVKRNEYVYLCISIVVLMYTISHHCVKSQIRMPPQIFVGAIFQEGDSSVPLEQAFKHGIDQVNKDRTVLGNTRLTSKIAKVVASNSFKASKKVCQLFQKEVVAIFGSAALSPATMNHIRSTSTALSVPLMEAGFEYLWERPAFSINVTPHPWAIGTAIANLIKTLSWKKFVIVYEDEESLVRLQEVAKLPKGFDSDLKVTFRQLNTDSTDYRPLLKQIKIDTDTRIVLDCSFEKIESVLVQALEVGLVTDYHSYIINSMDVERVDFSKIVLKDSRGHITKSIKDIDVNITSFRLVDPDTPNAREYLKDWTPVPDTTGVFGRGRAHPLFSDNVMMYDSVWTLAKALDQLGTMKPINVERVNCAETRQNTLAKKSADEILQKLIETDYEGLTGEIKLDKDPGAEFRSNIILDLMEKNGDRMSKTGTWTYESGVNYTKSESARQEETTQKLENKTLQVVTTLSKPYVMKKQQVWATKEPEALEAMTFSEKYEGYVVDLIRELSKEVKFKYKMYIVEDKNYGSFNEKTGQWNGMIRDLIDHKADLSCVDMSITSQRQRAVDFAMPYMNTGIGILYKKKKPPAPNLFQFMGPLSVDVWIYMITAYLCSSILMFLLGRITPYEWDNPHPCVNDPDELETFFDLKNCLWFGMGSLMCQGSDILPKAISTRTVASIWWFFTLIMISSYTANLAAFLTAAKMDSPVNNADDLAKQTKIKYGSKLGGSTYTFFKKSTIPTYAKMNAFMESAKPSVYTKGNQEGMDRVMKEDGAYAFFMEEAALKYYMARNCELTQIGGLLDNKGYGIGLPLESPYTKAISDGVLRMQEKGILTKLKTRWWNEKYVPEEKCAADEDNSAQLGLANLGGVFIVLLGGVIMSCLLAVAEFMWESRKLVMDREQSSWAAFATEMRFAVDCTAGDSKPNPDKEHSTHTSSNPSKSKGSKSILDDHSHPYGIIEDKDKDSAYAQFNDNLSAK